MERKEKKSRSDPAERSEGAANLGQGSPPFVSFYYQSSLECWNFLTKIGMNGVWVRADGTSSTVLDFDTRGSSY